MSYTITQLDANEHFSSKIYWSSLALLDTDLFVLAFAEESSSDGYVKAFTFDSIYDITEESVLEHDTTYGRYNVVAKIDSSHFILAYAASSSLVVKSFSIDARDYSIRQADSTTLYSDSASHLAIEPVGTVNGMLYYLIAYADADGYGVLDLVSVDPSTYEVAPGQGTGVPLTFTESLQNSTKLCLYDSEHCVVAYTGADYDGFIDTIEIINSGSFDFTDKTSLEHDSVKGYNNKLVKIDDTHVMLGYGQGENNYSYLKTFTISGTHSISQTDSYTNSTNYSYADGLVKIASDAFIFGWHDTSDESYLTPYTIDGSYNITKENTELLHYEYDTDLAEMILIDSSHLIHACYRFWRGYVKTFSVATIAATGWTGKIGGVTDPAKVVQIEVANIAKIMGVE